MPLPDKRKHAQKQYFAFIGNENSINRKPIFLTGAYSTSTAEPAVYKLIIRELSIQYLFFFFFILFQFIQTLPSNSYKQMTSAPLCGDKQTHSALLHRQHRATCELYAAQTKISVNPGCLFLHSTLIFVCVLGE